MKKIIGMAILFVALVTPVYAQDYVLDFYPVSLSGKMIQDGYTYQNLVGSGFEIVIAGYITGDTGDYIEGTIYDSNGNDYAYLYGNIIWNRATTAAYIQAAYSAYDDVVGYWTFYLNGTIKRTGSRFSISATGGETDTMEWENYPYVTTFSKISGYGVAQ